MYTPVLSTPSKEIAREIANQKEYCGKIDPDRLLYYVQSLSSDGNGKTIEECAQQWNVIDCEDAVGYCTCGHHITHQFLLKNKVTQNYLIVGSDCVTKFHSDELSRQMRMKSFEYLNMHGQLQDLRIKYVGKEEKTPWGSYNYHFRLRKDSNIYRALKEFEKHEDQWYPWYFTKDGRCIIIVSHKYRCNYERDQWQHVPISFNVVNNGEKLYINRRAAQR